MALWKLSNKGLSIPTSALPRPIFSRFTQEAKHSSDSDSDDDRKGDSGGVREMAGFMAEKAKKGTRKAAEMVFETGESKAEGKKESWAYWKDTAQKMKQDLLGDEHEKKKKNHQSHMND